MLDCLTRPFTFSARFEHSAVCTVLIALMLAGCGDDDTCDPGFVRIGGACVAITDAPEDSPDAGEDATSDAGGDIGDGCDGVDMDGVIDETMVNEGDACTGACGAGVAQCVGRELVCVVNTMEVCDGEDNDCDGQTDEGVLETFYIDSDNDGFGGEECLACTASDCGAGAISTGGDCNDSDNSIFPNADEACNGADDDCDEFVDEGLTIPTWYRDADNDGFGDPSMECMACRSDECEGGVFVDNNSDCNDDCSGCNPDGMDNICDGLDQDCDGTADEGLTRLGYLDQDGDGQGTGEQTMVCPDVHSRRGGDCHDGNALVFDFAEAQTTPYEALDGTMSWDYNCDGRAEQFRTICNSCGPRAFPYCWQIAPPGCGMMGRVRNTPYILVPSPMCSGPSGTEFMLTSPCR